MNREKVEELIGSALEYDPSYGVEDVLKEVSDYRAELWLGTDSLVISNVIDKPKVRQFHIWIAAGDLGELMDELYPAIEIRARELGCSVMTISGRRGWIRKLAAHGFGEVATVGIKELT